MEQLVTGGWQTIGWTCTQVSGSGNGGIQLTSKPLPYYTAGRWYRSYAAASIGGPGYVGNVQEVVSTSIKG